MTIGRLKRALSHLSDSGQIAIQIERDTYELDRVIICTQDDAIILVARAVQAEQAENEKNVDMG